MSTPVSPFSRSRTPVALGGRRPSLLLMLVGGMGIAVAAVAIVVAGLLTPWGSGMGSVALTAAPGLAGDLDLAPLSQRAIVYAADGSQLAIMHDGQDRLPVAIDDLPEHVPHAVLAAEDRKFFEHPGYDVEGIGRALVANVRAGEVEQGGSTITQQLAKTNFVGDEQSVGRKLEEIVYSIALEDRYDKRELLERYLNQIYFGSGAYGINAAAEQYYRTSAAELTVDQAAVLAGMIRAPARLDPRTAPDAVRVRRDAVIDGMVEMGVLDAAEAQEYKAAPIDVEPELHHETRFPHVVSAVRQELMREPALGDTPEERAAALLRGGMRIHTTIDPELQEAAREAVEENMDEAGPTAALVAVDPRSGRVRALHSGIDFAEQQFNLVTQGRRQPGSAFKPFVAAAALEAGFPVDIRLEGESGVVFEQVDGWHEEGVHNFENADFHLPDLRESMVSSINTAFAQLILAVGPDAVVDVAARVGIDVEQATGGTVDPAIALGGLHTGVTPLEMASAYGVFANGGEYTPPFVIDRIETADGEEVLTREPDPQQALDPAVAGTVNEFLQEVVDHGTGEAAGLSDWEEAGKTGTTQRNADAWFVGTVSTLSTAVWVGHAAEQIAMPGVTGGSTPAAIWRSFMSAALEGVDPEPFPDVDTDLSHLQDVEPAEMPDLDGMTRDEAAAALLAVRAIASFEEESSSATEDTVIWQSPDPGTDLYPGDEVFVGISTGSSGSSSSGSSSPDGGSGDSGDSGGGSEATPTPTPSPDDSDDSDGGGDGGDGDGGDDGGGGGGDGDGGDDGGGEDDSDDEGDGDGDGNGGGGNGGGGNGNGNGGGGNGNGNGNGGGGNGGGGGDSDDGDQSTQSAQEPSDGDDSDDGAPSG